MKPVPVAVPESTTKNNSYWLLAFPFLWVCAFSLKAFREPDLWWQIRTGQWIRAHHAVPKTDPFSFTQFDRPWINIKWASEVLASWLADAFGPETIPVLQVFTGLGIVYFLWKTARLQRRFSPQSFGLASLVMLLISEPRMTGRPEMASHFFTVVFLYLLMRFRTRKDGWIWLLLPLQTLWTNLHEAFALGPLMVAIFVVPEWIQAFRQNAAKPVLLTVLLGFMPLAILLNPYGAALLLRPLAIFLQVAATNKYTFELLSFTEAEYWQPTAFLWMAALSLTLLALANRDLRTAVFRPFGMGYVLLNAAFIALAFMANRNLIFSALALLPVWVFLLEKILCRWPSTLVSMLVGLAVYVGIVSNGWYRITGSHDRYGLYVSGLINPVGGGDFLKAHGAGKRRMFSDYLSSSYLLWRLQPDFKTYIDLRDLDVFPPAFFENYLHAVNDPTAFHALDSTLHFEYAVVYRNSLPRLHAYLYTDTVYACVFADPVVAIYQKTDNAPGGDIFSPPPPAIASPLARTISTVFNPLFSVPDDTDQNLDKEAARYYLNVGALKEARTRIQSYFIEFPEDEEAQEIMEAIKRVQPR
ncbi:MAG: hypothetical protein EOP52_10000 [Sphingobacteriales bacterium]|nr:MAG: hypothetical protein EOP52_10000 [Sphingobacteriales bacterium]